MIDDEAKIFYDYFGGELRNALLAIYDKVAVPEGAAGSPPNHLNGLCKFAKRQTRPANLGKRLEN